MKTCSRAALQLAVVCLALSAASFAADNAYLYIVHGIPGRDVAANLNPGLPIDVQLNDDVCYVKGLGFGSTSGPLTLPAGKVEVKISLANSLAPCSNPSVVDTTVAVGADKNVSAVLALDGSGAPTLLSFVDNLDTVVVGEGRVVFAHAADAPALQLTLTQLGVKNPVAHTYTANPGKEVMVTLPVGTYSLQATTGTTTIPLDNVVAESQAVSLTYIVGSASNNSVGLVTRVIRDVF
jgi:Domain of unknown function (DUF4397)